MGLVGTDMQEAQVTEEDEPPVIETPGALASHRISIRKCKLVRGRLVPRGKKESMDISQAFSKLAPMGTQRGQLNVMRMRTGDFIGLRKGSNSNFRITNPTSDGDIRWLLQMHPNFKSSISDIYLVDDVVIRRVPVEVNGGEEES